MKNLLRSKYSLPFLVVFIILLYVSLNKLIVPWVMKALDSSVFFEEEKEEEQLGKIKNPRTDFALIRCKEGIREEGKFPDSAEFINTYEAWALGNRTYIIRSAVKLAEPGKAPVEQPFACQIRLVGDDETDVKNWNILGIDTNPDAQGG
jgi:hypothetical protein